MVDVPLCVRLYASDARGMLVGLIAGLEEELCVMPRHRFNTQKIVDRERGLAMYRESLARHDRTVARSLTAMETRAH